MRQRFFRALVALIVVTITAISANAQNVNNKVNAKNFSACKEYLAAHPTDTIANVYHVEKDGENRMVLRRVVFLKEGQVVSKTDTLAFRRTTSNDLSLAEKEQVLKGERTAVDPHHKNLEGKLRHHVQLSVLGGISTVGGVAPVATLRGAYETCHFLFEAEGSYSTFKYTEKASISGNYTTWVFGGNVGWKMWQDLRCRSYLALVGSAGYALQKSDVETADIYAKNYGFTFGASVRGSWGVTPRLRLIGEAGVRLFPKVYNDGGNQEFDNFGFTASVGLGYTF